MVGDRVADGRGVLDAADAGDVLVPVLQQVAGGELGAADVVGDDGDVVDRLGALVEEDHPRVPGLDLAGGLLAHALADQDQARYPHAEEGPQVVDLALGAVVGVADEHHFPALGGGLFDRVRHLREERLTGVRDDHAYEVGAPRRHRLRDPVRAVAQILDRGEDTLARGRGNRPGSVVDDVAHDGGRGTRKSRHVIPRHLGHARQSTRGDLPLGRVTGSSADRVTSAASCAAPCAAVCAEAWAAAWALASAAARSTFSGVTKR